MHGVEGVLDSEPVVSASKFGTSGPKLLLLGGLLGGLRVTNPTIRLACPSVCLSVCLSVNISLVNTITQQILGALIRNLYHGCISGVSWLSSKMDNLDLFLRSRGSI